MRTCYVAMPLGIKHDADGRELDFDFLYREVIQPAVQALDLDLECRRLEELSGGAIWHKTLLHGADVERSHDRRRFDAKPQCPVRARGAPCA
jgi:hypothetical protein